MTFDLEVYKKAYKLALGLHKISLQLPQKEQFGGIADQIRRASKSICANIAEGLGKHTTLAEERRFLTIAIGSAEEMSVWLDFMRDLNYADADKVKIWQEHYDQIRKMLYALLKRR